MRRQALAQIKPIPTTHAGLWLDRFLTEDSADDETKAKASLVEQVAGLQVPALYTHFYNRWAANLEQAGATCRIAEVQGRMIVGLGNTSPIETSMCLQHTYGVPYIPGSAIKGLVAAYARQQLGSIDQAWAKPELTAETPLNGYLTMFGHTGSAGYLTFFDALYIPNNSQPLAIDVMTPHHMSYQQDNNLQAPTDFDSPNPVAFLSATGSYLFAIGGEEAWVTAAFAILEKALLEYGIGAKTSSGYGRLKLASPPRDTKQDALEQFLADFNRLRSNQFASQISRYIQQWNELQGTSQKRAAAETIVKMARVVMREKDLQSKKWFTDLIEYIEQHP